MRRRRASTAALFLLTAAGLLVSVVTATLFGSADIQPLDVVSTILRHIGLEAIAPTPPLPGLHDALIWQSRFPRVLLAAVIGMALAVSGAVLQAVTRNPLADPYLLGVSSGASTGAVAVLLLGIGGSISLSTGAFAGGLVSFGVLLVLLGGGRVASPARVVLTGVLVSQFFAAVTSVILMVSGDANSTRGFTYWLLGTLAGARWEAVTVTVVIILIGVAAVQFFAPALDAFTFGWDSAEALGINVTAARVWLMVLTSVMTAAAVAASGAIGFIGLLVPHAVRILAGPTHRCLLPLSAIVGAIFLIWVDVFARTAFSPHELPAGVITALLGAPAFALVLKRLES
ncbi:iron ABC transporter permease [Streptomyces sp. ICN441]|uniref:Iron ABC transporter permease n=1 Tax=Streptomyces tirandamycinicus TaxID=2174846 RepID=A0A2S1T1A0_9ACTN|nr:MULTISPECIES: iron chelate uptake ABC transporter family permease subunit [Streptomyces]AWI32432.1 iron ABC transporter permease [Streptomyces tirandamycinicus]MCY0982161.1 iron chelate uptake ABC transporter family permease subunit [Streptomyces tirandamycinicus]NNJ07184.1 iron chelate uptake ABC transporter family permease subunit [Streptomyces sp. PKU-MA01144]TFE43346.1 iron ABC transporter permease [Streptomyces sp. ICN441]